MNIIDTLEHIQNLAEENTKGLDGYEQIAEWCRKQLKDYKKWSCAEFLENSMK